MWIRSAFWSGQPRAGQEQTFHDMVENELVPAMRRFPGVARVRALWPRKLEDSPPPVYCQVLVEYATREDLDKMLASDERKALRPRVLEAVGMFDGSVSHIDYEVTHP